jgi:hypothetical protein
VCCPSIPNVLVAPRSKCGTRREALSLNMTDDQHTLDDLKKAFICDPEHWRNRAEEARILANEMNDSKTKDAMLRIADEYEHLARWVEDWAMRRLAKN